MVSFRMPMINLYSKDLPRAVAFYTAVGFVESFRTPALGDAVHVELKLDGFTIGIATLEAARADHGLDPDVEGHSVEIVLWTDDTDAAVDTLTRHGARVLASAHDFLEGKLRAAWIADPDGNPVQLVQKKA